jgi:DNA-binding winged helix-turn-helix (wHTH) protein/predicted ATPase
MDDIRKPIALSVYVFAGFVFDPAVGELSRSDGSQARLRPKSAQVLEFLLDNAGRAVSREELLATIWPDISISEESITQCVADVRRALGSGSAELLRTLPRRGYLLSADVTYGAAPAPTPTEAIPQSIAEPTARMGAEQRQLTVLFCEAVGPRHDLGSLDLESLRDATASYHGLVATISARYETHFTLFPGNWAAIYFGWPAARENDAERAVRAALALSAAAGPTGRGTALEFAGIRVGIATGPVIIGETAASGGSPIPNIVGTPTSRAARLASTSQPGAVTVDVATRRLAGALFEYADCPGIGFFGEAWKGAARVVRESRVEGRYEALRGSNHPPMIGRDEELALLLRRWHRAASGDGQVALVAGEPGIGKSRLVAALQGSIGAQPHTRVRHYCSPHLRDSALHPVIAQLERAAGFERDDSVAMRLGKLEAWFASTGAEDVEGVTLIGDLLGLGDAARGSMMPQDAERKREKTLWALLRLLERLARQRPVLMIFEDVHWADSTSLELLDRTIDRIARLPVLLVISYRPEFQPTWIGQPEVSLLALSRLPPRDSAAVVDGLTAGKKLPPKILDHIIERTDGVPLFVEELTKSLLEGGQLRETEDAFVLDGQLPRSAIPSSLQTSLLARLDGLPSCKELAQTGAAIGREFSYELLAAVAGGDEVALLHGLDRLLEAGLIFRRGTPPRASYVFKHALVQDAAYSTLVRGRRQELHAAIGLALERQFPCLIEQQPSLAAHHFGEAGLGEQAAVYWCRAGRQSVARSALVEAVSQLRRGLLILGEVPETPKRESLEIDLQVTLAGALMSVKGFAHPDVIAAFERARELIAGSAAAGTLVHFSVLYGLYAANFVGGRPKPALEQARTFLSLAEAQTQSGLLLMGHRVVGTVLALVGDYPAALTHLERAVAMYRPEEHQDLAFRFGADIGVSALSSYALALWNRGYPDQARKTADEAISRARQLSHAHTLAYALVVVGVTAISARWLAMVEDIADEVVALAQERSFAFFLGWGLTLQGWVMGQRGQGAPAVERVRQGLDATAATCGRNYRPMLMGLLAETLATSGEVENGLAAITDALALAESSGQTGTDAELHRLKGELLANLPRPNRSAAEACFNQALAVAKNQGAHGFELRASVSLARLLGSGQRRREAHQILAAAYASFVEGFATPDLEAAKMLLEELAEAHVQ